MKYIAGRKKRVVEREERVEMEILDEGECRIMMLIYFQHLIILFLLFFSITTTSCNTTHFSKTYACTVFSATTSTTSTFFEISSTTLSGILSANVKLNAGFVHFPHFFNWTST